MVDQSNITLTRRDLLQFESLLKDTISEFLPFASASLFFPASLEPKSALAKAVQSEQAIFLKDEKRLLLPLVFKGNLLGVFVATNVRFKDSPTSRAYLFHLARLAVENVSQLKVSLCDPLTGLLHRHSFEHKVAQDIQRVSSCILPGAAASMDCSLSSHIACFGVLLFQFDRLQHLSRIHGTLFRDTLLLRMAEITLTMAGERGVPAHMNDGAFALFLPQMSPQGCAKTAQAILDRLRKEHIALAGSNETLQPSGSVGFTNYPQDLLGWELKTPALEQSRSIISKASRALRAASQDGGGRICSFSDILAHEGRIVGVLPLNRVTINLGHAEDALEGQRFLIWPRGDTLSLPAGGGQQKSQPADAAPPRGEIQVMKVGEETSLAEILFLSDPKHHAQVGDQLTLLIPQDAPPLIPGENKKTRKIKHEKNTILPFRDFLQAWTKLRAEASVFSMTLARFDGPASLENGKITALEASMKALTSQMNKSAPQAIIGRYSHNTLAVYFPSGDAKKMVRRFARMTQRSKSGWTLSFGLAEYPFLNFAKADVLDLCAKALEHALMMEPPRVALCDSVSFNISADRHFARNDLYSSVEEYKIALLADPNNLTARNSLGICYARLGHFSRARRHFAAILEASPDNLMAQYNFGCICLKLGEAKDADHAFSKCLDLEPDHVYSQLRLAQLAEERGNLKKAKSCLRSGLKGTVAIALIHGQLARLALKEKKMEQAREHLQLALTADPNDAYSLHLLAQLYLDTGEDPQVAEALAKQSVALRPDKPQYWKEVVRALDRQGRGNEIHALRLRLKGEFADIETGEEQN